MNWTIHLIRGNDMNQQQFSWELSVICLASNCDLTEWVVKMNLCRVEVHLIRFCLIVLALVFEFAVHRKRINTVSVEKRS